MVALRADRVERRGDVIGYPGPFASPAVEIMPTPKPWHDAVEAEWTGRHARQVVMAKGLIPGILDAETLEAVVAPGLLRGRIWYVFDATWTPLGCLVTGSGEVRAYDPSTSEYERLCEGGEWQDHVPMGGSGEFVLVAGCAARRFNVQGTEARRRR